MSLKNNKLSSINNKHSLTIGWLYPDLMNTYGDRGNIIVLKKRAEWRNIEINISQISVDTDESELNKLDLFFMGGAQDTQQEIVNRDLLKHKGKIIIKKIENGTPGLFICGAYQFLGKYYVTADNITLSGLGLFDMFTDNSKNSEKRLIGNALIKPVIAGLTQTLVGFENHGGKTYLSRKSQRLGDVIAGFGNNGKDGSEGVVYKNAFGTYLHGPILPKNPELADLLLTLALEQKYGQKFHLEPLDDSLEQNARQHIISRIK